MKSTEKCIHGRWLDDPCVKCGFTKKREEPRDPTVEQKREALGWPDADR